MNEIDHAATRAVTVLSVSPLQDDHACLRSIFSHSKWILYSASTMSSALRILRRREVPIVICERDLQPDTWKDMLGQLSLMPNRPVLLVTSLLADEYLWGEALNLGAYDVLAKPFDPQEVFRSISLAWLHWKHRFQSNRALTAAGGDSALHTMGRPAVAV